MAESMEGLDDDLLFAADLLTGELVANAFLHAGTEIAVQVNTSSDGARIAVTDGAPDRHVVPRHHDPEAMIGRGLQLVEAMSSRFGVSVADDTKTVWFEIRADDRAIPVSTWDTPASPLQTHVTIQLLDAPVGLTRAAQRHRSALLREAQLALLAEVDGFGVRQEDLAATAGLNDLIDSALNTAYDQLPPGSATMRCMLEVPPDSGPAAATLAWVLDALNAAATEGAFLTRPALPEVRRYRVWMIGEILRQLDNDPPMPWTMGPAGDDAVKVDPVQWDAGQIHETDVATIAADDDNRVIAVNRAAGRLLGWDPDRLIGQRLTVIIPPSHRDRHVAGFTTFLLTGEARVMGVPIRVPALRSDGTMVSVNLTVGVEHSNLGRVVFVGELRPVE